MLARYVHKKSKRADKPFIAVNCAAIPEQLLESELFGHEKGAFTGAVARRIGKFEEADGGTLLLDEISEMDLRLQSKLLRALQERVIDRVGGGKPVPVNIRVLATSNRDLGALVRAGEFREDLLYRLNVVNLRIPPLRERKDDLAALARFFIDKYARANGRPARKLSQRRPDASAGARLARQRARTRKRHAPRGAAGERRGSRRRSDPRARRRAGRRARATIWARRSKPAKRPRAHSVGRTVADVEQDLILETLTHCLGNRTHAAHILGISIRTLRNKLKLYSRRRRAHSAAADGASGLSR